MPLYEYACESCQHEFETLVSDGDEIECPQCRSRQLHRHLSLPARPQTTTASLALGCDPSTPPCGAMCRKIGRP